MVKDYVLNSRLIQRSERLAAYAADILKDDETVISAALAFTWRIFNKLTFEPIATTVSTAPEEVLNNNGGVCQDFYI